ncbi:DUF7344 domain-containing protein [Halopelagius fulvigenes]|uniref:DUF7344 domain-containing protein n=1 Tax=Halopelagius fulvigenes TaxID=1198324 RepID=A0ABD5U5A9_9EURY
MSDSTPRRNEESIADSRSAPASRLDSLFDVLTDQRRRFALRCLSEYDTPMTLADLADEVAVREQEQPLTEIPAEDVMQVYLSLYHAHIPKLVDVGVAEYSQEQDLVYYEESHRIERILDSLAADE